MMNIKRSFIVYAIICICLPMLWVKVASSDKGPYTVWSENIDGNLEVFFKNENWSESDTVRLSYSEGMDVTPVVLEDSDALIWVIWAHVKANQSTLFYSTSQGGIEWSMPEVVQTGIVNNTAPSIVLDNKNGLWLFWSGNQGDSPDDVFSARWDGDQWEKPLRIHAANDYPDILPHAMIDGSGVIEVTWVSLNQGIYVAKAAIYINSKWFKQKKISTEVAANLAKAQQESSEEPQKSPQVLLNRLINGRSASNGTESVSKESDSADPNQHYDEIFLTFGDSITFGIGGSGYQGELLRILTRNGRSAKLYNLGKQGETTVEGVNRLDYYLAEVPADYILLLEGTNDIRYGISLQTTMANLSAMLDKSVAANVEPVIANLTPDSTDSGYNRVIVNSYNPKIKALAARKTITFSDQYTPLRQNWSAYTDDGLHPNSAGYNVMATTWYDAIVRLGQKPIVETRAPAGVQATNATLSALVTPNGTETRCYFEYGSGERLTFNSEEFQLGAEKPQTPVSVTVHGLKPLTEYRYRAVAINETGKKAGEIRSFKTIEKDSGGSSGVGGGGGCFIDTLFF